MQSLHGSRKRRSLYTRTLRQRPLLTLTLPPGWSPCFWLRTSRGAGYAMLLRP
ncbi:hypothetical protein MBAV_004816 [Candidatus Magnetobacterium bavaricum]|uniref:Uncharacterized protein n=1 Tax=Candidatus Magnetobacterium bavaricum TaxID=29290 RepID=A0A0F3GM44_9BACT|nr:hypothetical protein MBAV_004816 [Candidatus Magnetobacterium bavaricum]